VLWSINDEASEDGVTIDVASGKLVVPSDATVETITVTATSVYDKTKTGIATITVA
jgi:phosphotransferase system IIA component